MDSRANKKLTVPEKAMVAYVGTLTEAMKRCLQTPYGAESKELKRFIKNITIAWIDFQNVVWANQGVMALHKNDPELGGLMIPFEKMALKGYSVVKSCDLERVGT
jgi:hypothetical protein